MLVPWMIEALEPPNVTFREFLSQKVDLDGLRLENTFVGRSKDSLDSVAPDLVAADVIQTFGRAFCEVLCRADDITYM